MLPVRDMEHKNNGYRLLPITSYKSLAMQYCTMEIAGVSVSVLLRAYVAAVVFRLSCMYHIETQKQRLYVAMPLFLHVREE